MAAMYAKYFTNMDDYEFENAEYQNALYDYFAANDIYPAEYDYLIDDGWGQAKRIFEDLSGLLIRKHEAESNPVNKFIRMLNEYMGMDDLEKKMAETREVNEKMIDMMNALKEKEEKTVDKAQMMLFAKK